MQLARGGGCGGDARDNINDGVVEGVKAKERTNDAHISLAPRRADSPENHNAEDISYVIHMSGHYCKGYYFESFIRYAISSVQSSHEKVGLGLGPGMRSPLPYLGKVHMCGAPRRRRPPSYLTQFA